MGKDGAHSVPPTTPDACSPAVLPAISKHHFSEAEGRDLPKVMLLVSG